MDLDGGSADKAPSNANLTLLAGDDIVATVRAFCMKHAIGQDGVTALEGALRTRVAALPLTPPALLTVGVIGPTGQRHVLGILEGTPQTYSMISALFPL